MPSALTVPFISGSTRSLNAEMKPRVSFAMSLLLVANIAQVVEALQRLSSRMS